ncbi:MAG: hypothetical protein ACRD3B_06345 [Candidatus Sulfotelmatobacter sp.]
MEVSHGQRIKIEKGHPQDGEGVFGCFGILYRGAGVFAGLSAVLVFVHFLPLLLSPFGAGCSFLPSFERLASWAVIFRRLRQGYLIPP